MRDRRGGIRTIVKKKKSTHHKNKQLALFETTRSRRISQSAATTLPFAKRTTNHPIPRPAGPQSSLSVQSSVIRICSNGMGVKLFRSIPRDKSSGSVQAATSCRFKSGRIDSSMGCVDGWVRRMDGHTSVSQPVINGAPIKPNTNVNSPSRVKSNSLGNSRPLGMRTPSCRSSSKNVCTIPSIAPNRMLGVYSSKCETRSMASGDVRGRKTCQINGFVCQLSPDRTRPQNKQ